MEERKSNKRILMKMLLWLNTSSHLAGFSFCFQVPGIRQNSSEDWFSNGTFQDLWQMGGKEVSGQVKVLSTVSQIPTSVPGGSASHGQVQLCRQALQETSGPWAWHRLKMKCSIRRCSATSILRSPWCRPKTPVLLKTCVKSGLWCSFGSELIHNWPLDKAGIEDTDPTYSWKSTYNLSRPST